MRTLPLWEKRLGIMPANVEEATIPTDIRVGIVHRVRVVREALASSLRREPGIAIVDVASEPTSPPRGQGPVQADLVLIEATCEFDALEGRIQGVKRRYCETKILTFGVTNSRNDILACIEAGASAYTLSEASPDELMDTIRSVHLGGMACPPEVATYLFERLATVKRELGGRQDSKLEKFTRRESQILQLVADGLSNKEIASLLGLELQTVKNYVHNILEKLRVQSRRAAAAYALSVGLVEAGPRES